MVMEARIYKALNNPWLYRLSQRILAPGHIKAIVDQIEKTLREAPSANLLVDVGCGPISWLHRVGLRPVGVDLSMTFLREFRQLESRAILASALALPFSSKSIEGVISVFLFHHMPDYAVSEAMKEFMRVCKSPGYVAILDGVLPRAPWKNPLATLIRRMDRGKFMRSQEELESLLPERDDWIVKRFTYSLTGLEGLICLYVK